jgi:glycosyltransferase involved in cell wall biosynthesis
MTTTSDSSTTRPAISVIIPHLNQPAHLDACLSSLDGQSLDRTLFEVIVVDNGSISPPASIVAGHCGMRLLHESRPGPGPARNCGVQAANGDILAFIDADCRAHSEWLRTARQVLCSSPEGTVLGGDVRIWRDNDKAFTAIEAYESVFGYRFKLYIEQHGFCGTGNLAIYRADFEKIGLFAGVQVAEDIEWGRRACAAGFKFRYVPEMIVFHPARHSLSELYLKWDRHIQHGINMSREEHLWRIRWIARALALLASPMVDFVTVLRSDRIQGVSSRLKAIAVLMAVRAHRARKMLSVLGASASVVWNQNVGA